MVLRRVKLRSNTSLAAIQQKPCSTRLPVLPHQIHSACKWTSIPSTLLYEYSKVHYCTLMISPKKTLFDTLICILIPTLRWCLSQILSTDFRNMHSRVTPQRSKQSVLSYSDILSCKQEKDTFTKIICNSRTEHMRTIAYWFEILLRPRQERMSSSSQTALLDLSRNLWPGSWEEDETILLLITFFLWPMSSAK